MVNFFDLYYEFIFILKIKTPKCNTSQRILASNHEFKASHPKTLLPLGAGSKVVQDGHAMGIRLFYSVR